MAADARLHGFGRAGLAAWMLAAACGWAALLWLGALSGMGGRIAEALPLAAGSLPAPAAAKPDRIGALSQYAVAAARPLFTQDRRPRGFLATGSEAGQGGAEPARLDFVLTGVLISPQVRLAVLQPTAGGDSQRVREGASPEGAEGWRLVAVEPRRAVFAGSTGQLVLDLRSFGAPGTARKQITARPANAFVGSVDASAATAAAQAAAEAAAAAVAEGRPVPLPPPTPPAQQDDTQARVEAIRRRIEARRAQMQAGGQQLEDNPGPPRGTPGP